MNLCGIEPSTFQRKVSAVSRGSILLSSMENRAGYIAEREEAEVL